jgi:glycine dehydrogenase subunit 2
MLALLFEMQEMLAEIAGLPAVSLQPAAGAQGEFTALLVAAAYFRDRGEDRTKVIFPSSAHGTNPASAALAGFDTVQLKPTADGLVDLNELGSHLDEKTAVFMITNPNTVGLFEPNIRRIASMLHDVGGLVYVDGANMNAILGITRPGDFGGDMMHYNVHKTFTGPHGAGGPGAGPIAVREFLADYLPGPVVVQEAGGRRQEAGGRGQRAEGQRSEGQRSVGQRSVGQRSVGQKSGDASLAARFTCAATENRYELVTPAKSIGRVRSFFGNVGILVRGYCYLRTLGPEGLRAVSENAVLNANYLRSRLEDLLPVPHGRRCMHEFVASARRVKQQRGISAMDIAKRLLDFGFHAPTVYFPLDVPEALMIEPTETESKETLDRFTDAVRAILKEDPELLHSAPHTTTISRPDEVAAGRNPCLRWS